VCTLRYQAPSSASLAKLTAGSRCSIPLHSERALRTPAAATGSSAAEHTTHAAPAYEAKTMNRTLPLCSVMSSVRGT
jgi:hypothetical protein